MIRDDNIQQNLTFGLDIGTRNVVGIVGYNDGDQFIIEDWIIIEHEPRAMIDGQIHDIIKVSKVINEVKEKLEDRLQCTLNEVSIAAAGRVLKTTLMDSFIEFNDEITITKNHIQSLELVGVEEAQKKIKDMDEGDFFCVGFTVVKYFLNNYEMENLEAHKAKRIGIRILATFLPQIVIDSLYTAVSKSGLSVSNLSLEPIAAINAAIPKSYRLLNLALVDVGAGTSDIALTREGSVVAYGMIPMAGDELTEQIIHKYLVDFHTAEKIKLSLNSEEEIVYKDIIGIEHKVTSKSVLKYIRPTLVELTDNIASKLIELNGMNPPNAVFCVGGGCQLPGFTDLLASKLKLPKERVVLKSTDDLINIHYNCEKFSNPSMVTPVGICITSVEDKGKSFIELYLNDQKVKLLNARQLTVMDAAVKVGFNYMNLMARKGKDLTFTLNNETKKVRGGLGEAANIFVNNKPANLHTNIFDEDYIVIHPAKPGDDAKATISDIIKKHTYEYIVNGDKIPAQPEHRVNNELVDREYNIQNNDNIEIYDVKLLADLLNYLNISDYNAIFVNGAEVGTEYILSTGDEIYIEENKDKVEEIRLEPKTQEKIIEDINKIVLPTSNMDILVTVNDENIILKDKKDYIFVDIFEYYAFDLRNPKGKIQLKLNGNDAAYTDALANNDVLEIYWE